MSAASNLVAAGLAVLAWAGPAAAATDTDTWLDATATITAPDGVPAGVDFLVEVEGSLARGPSEITAYELWRDADWSYDGRHRVLVAAGLLIEEDGFVFGDLARNWVFNEPAGLYRYTFAFGDRGGVHDWYDVVVEVEVLVTDGPCGRAGPPAEAPLLSVSTARLAWTAVPEDEGHDVVRGDLGLLWATGGDFEQSVIDCLADDLAALSLDRPDLPGVSTFFLVRPGNCAGAGSWDSSSARQLEPRGPGLAAAPGACP